MKPIEKAERYTLSKLVVQNLKQYMIQHNMTPGEKLPAERELAQIMNVSRAILREALRSLESAGILDIRHGEGAFLSANSLNPLIEQMSFAAKMSGGAGKEFLEVRYLLEAAVVDEAIVRGNAFPMRELEHWRAAAADPDVARDQAAEADAQLHLAVVRALGNDSLTALAELFIRQAASPASGQPSAERRAAEHDRYISALGDADAGQAKRVLREHLGAGPAS